MPQDVGYRGCRVDVLPALDPHKEGLTRFFLFILRVHAEGGGLVFRPYYNTR